MGEKEKAESESITYVKRGRRAGRIVAAAVIAGCLLTGAGAMAAVTQYKKSAENSYDVTFDGEIISVSSRNRICRKRRKRQATIFAAG